MELLPEDVLNEFIQLTQTNIYIKDTYWKKYYDQYHTDLRLNFPSLSYKNLVKILYQVDLLMNESLNNNVYVVLKKPMPNPTSLVIKSRLVPPSAVIRTMTAINLKPRYGWPTGKIELLPEHHIVNEDNKIFEAIGKVKNIKLFLSYLIDLDYI